MKQERTGVRCALCGEEITLGEEIIRCGEQLAHYECYRYNAPSDAVERFLGIVREMMN